MLILLVRCYFVVKTRVDFQPIMLGSGPGPYSSSGASGAIYLATNHDSRRKRAKAQLLVTRVSGGFCANLVRVLTQFFYYGFELSASRLDTVICAPYIVLIHI